LGGFLCAAGVYPGLVAARHWLGGGVRNSGGSRPSGELVGMTHAPGCLCTAGAWSLALAEANDVVESERFSCVDGVRR